eukprot:Clim_evm7s246 gene=Clim_evmTU7s246
MAPAQSLKRPLDDSGLSIAKKAATPASFALKRFRNVVSQIVQRKTGREVDVIADQCIALCEQYADELSETLDEEEERTEWCEVLRYITEEYTSVCATLRTKKVLFDLYVRILNICHSINVDICDADPVLAKDIYVIVNFLADEVGEHEEHVSTLVCVLNDVFFRVPAYCQMLDHSGYWKKLWLTLLLIIRKTCKRNDCRPLWMTIRHMMSKFNGLRNKLQGRPRTAEPFLVAAKAAVPTFTLKNSALLEALRDFAYLGGLDQYVSLVELWYGSEGLGEKIKRQIESGSVTSVIDVPGLCDLLRYFASFRCFGEEHNSTVWYQQQVLLALRQPHRLKTKSSGGDHNAYMAAFVSDPEPLTSVADDSDAACTYAVMLLALRTDLATEIDRLLSSVNAGCDSPVCRARRICNALLINYCCVIYHILRVGCFIGAVVPCKKLYNLVTVKLKRLAVQSSNTRVHSAVLSCANQLFRWQFHAGVHTGPHMKWRNYADECVDELVALDNYDELLVLHINVTYLYDRQVTLASTKLFAALASPMNSDRYNELATLWLHAHRSQPCRWGDWETVVGNVIRSLVYSKPASDLPNVAYMVPLLFQSSTDAELLDPIAFDVPGLSGKADSHSMHIYQSMLRMMSNFSQSGVWVGERDFTFRSTIMSNRDRQRKFWLLVKRALMQMHHQVRDLANLDKVRSFLRMAILLKCCPVSVPEAKDFYDSFRKLLIPALKGLSGKNTTEILGLLECLLAQVSQALKPNFEWRIQCSGAQSESSAAEGLLTQTKHLCCTPTVTELIDRQLFETFSLTLRRALDEYESVSKERPPVHFWRTYFSLRRSVECCWIDMKATLEGLDFGPYVMRTLGNRHLRDHPGLHLELVRGLFSVMVSIGSVNAENTKSNMSTQINSLLKDLASTTVYPVDFFMDFCQTISYIITLANGNTAGLDIEGHLLHILNELCDSYVCRDGLASAFACLLRHQRELPIAAIPQDVRESMWLSVKLVGLTNDLLPYAGLPDNPRQLATCFARRPTCMSDWISGTSVLDFEQMETVMDLVEAIKVMVSNFAYDLKENDTRLLNLSLVRWQQTPLVKFLRHKETDCEVRKQILHLILDCVLAVGRFSFDDRQSVLETLANYLDPEFRGLEALNRDRQALYGATLKGSDDNRTSIVETQRRNLVSAEGRSSMTPRVLQKLWQKNTAYLLFYGVAGTLTESHKGCTTSAIAYFELFRDRAEIKDELLAWMTKDQNTLVIALSQTNGYISSLRMLLPRLVEKDVFPRYSEFCRWLLTKGGRHLLKDTVFAIVNQTLPYVEHRCLAHSVLDIVLAAVKWAVMHDKDGRFIENIVPKCIDTLCILCSKSYADSFAREISPGVERIIRLLDQTAGKKEYFDHLWNVFRTVKMLVDPSIHPMLASRVAQVGVIRTDFVPKFIKTLSEPTVLLDLPADVVLECSGSFGISAQPILAAAEALMIGRKACTIPLYAVQTGHAVIKSLCPDSPASHIFLEVFTKHVNLIDNVYRARDIDSFNPRKDYEDRLVILCTSLNPGLTHQMITSMPLSLPNSATVILDNSIFDFGSDAEGTSRQRLRELFQRMAAFSRSDHLTRLMNVSNTAVAQAMLPHALAIYIRQCDGGARTLISAIQTQVRVCGPSRSTAETLFVAAILDGFKIAYDEHLHELCTGDLSAEQRQKLIASFHGCTDYRVLAEWSVRHGRPYEALMWLEIFLESVNASVFDPSVRDLLPTIDSIANALNDEHLRSSSRMLMACADPLYGLEVFRGDPSTIARGFVSLAQANPPVHEYFNRIALVSRQWTMAIGQVGRQEGPELSMHRADCAWRLSDWGIQHGSGAMVHEDGDIDRMLAPISFGKDVSARMASILTCLFNTTPGKYNRQSVESIANSFLSCSLDTSTGSVNPLHEEFMLKRLGEDVQRVVSKLTTHLVQGASSEKLAVDIERTMLSWMEEDTKHNSLALEFDRWEIQHTFRLRLLDAAIHLGRLQDSLELQRLRAMHLFHGGQRALANNQLTVAADIAAQVQRSDCKSPISSLVHNFLQARLMWELNDRARAVKLLQYTVDHLNESHGQMYDEVLATAYLTCGRWHAHEFINQDELVIGCYDKTNSLSADYAVKSDARFALASFADERFRQLRDYFNGVEYNDREKRSVNRKTEIRKLESLTKRTRDQLRRLKTLKMEDMVHTQSRSAVLQQFKKHLLCSISNYAKGLQYSEGHGLQVFRLVALVNDDSIKDLGFKQSVIAKIEQEAVTQMHSVPIFLYIRVFYQLLAIYINQVGTRPTPQSSGLRELLQRCARRYPYHCIPTLLAMVNTTDSIESKRKAEAGSILNTLNGRGQQVLNRYKGLFDAYLRLTSIGGRSQNAGTHSIPESTGILDINADMSYPIITRNIPLPPDGVIRDGTDVISIHAVSKTYFIPGGVNLPKKVTVVGTDGKRYAQLVKTEDLRQDMVMEQVFELFNSLFNHSRVSHADEQRLRMRTFKIVPISQVAGVLEWCEGTRTLSDYLLGGRRGGRLGAHERYRPQDIKPNEARDRIMKTQNETEEKRLSVYRWVCANFKPVFRYYFRETAQNAQAWHRRRLSYTRSMATASIIGYVVGLGDRHVGNLLVDDSTAEVVHIDLGVAFDQGRFLAVPERVPFRLTRDLVDGMGPTSYEGQFRTVCENVMRMVRMHNFELETIIEVFLYDPLNKWQAGVENRRRRQRGDAALNEMDTSEEPCDDAFSILDTLRQKMNGIADGIHSTVEAQVQRLILQATDEKNLSHHFHGWKAFV